MRVVRGSLGRQQTPSPISSLEYAEPASASRSLPDSNSGYLKRRKRRITAVKSFISALLGAVLIGSGVMFWPVIAVGWSYLCFALGAIGGMASLGYLIKFLVLRKLDDLLP